MLKDDCVILLNSFFQPTISFNIQIANELTGLKVLCSEVRGQVFENKQENVAPLIIVSVQSKPQQTGCKAAKHCKH